MAVRRVTAKKLLNRKNPRQVAAIKNQRNATNEAPYLPPSKEDLQAESRLDHYIELADLVLANKRKKSKSE